VIATTAQQPARQAHAARARPAPARRGRRHERAHQFADCARSDGAARRGRRSCRRRRPSATASTTAKGRAGAENKSYVLGALDDDGGLGRAPTSDLDDAGARASTPSLAAPSLTRAPARPLPPVRGARAPEWCAARWVLLVRAATNQGPGNVRLCSRRRRDLTRPAPRQEPAPPPAG
jgi:hypothetical protein